MARSRRAPEATETASRLEYEQRVNRVIDHIRAHLGDELSLEGLARIAAFSPFHFHRIFRAITGEAIFAFIHRQRLERAAVALLHHRNESVLAAALDHGFASAATFARAFRAHFGMTATAWRNGGAKRWSKRGKANRKRGKAVTASDRHRSSTRRNEPTMNVAIRALGPYHVAYMRRVGPYGAHGIPALWERLTEWMTTHDLAGAKAVKLGIGLDDPAVTPPGKCRYDACVVVPPEFPADRRVNVTDIPGGKYAVTSFVGTAHEIGGAWDALYRSWLPTSGYEPDNRPCLEVYRGDPAISSRPGVFRCEVCVPVRPL